MPCLFVLVALLAAPEPTGPACPGRQVRCDKSPGGCRVLREDLLRIDEEAYHLVVGFARAKLEAGKVALQQVAPEVQKVRDRYRLLVLEYNACTWTDDEYQERVDHLLAYDGRVQEAGRLVTSVEQASRRAVANETDLEAQRRALADLSGLMKRLGAETARLGSELASSRGRIAALEVQTDGARPGDAALRSEMTSLAEGVREQLAAWSQAVEAQVGSRTDALAEELRRLRGDVGRLQTAMGEGRLDERRFAVLAMPTLTWIGGGLRPGLWVSLELPAPSGRLPSGLSLALEVGGVWWKDRPSFATLPGVPLVHYERNNGFLLTDCWLRYSRAVGASTRPFVAISAGVLAQPWYGWGTPGLAFQGAVGVTLHLASWRLGIEARYGALQLRSREIRFDPFGGARVDERQRFRGALGLGLVFSPLAW